MPYLAPVYQQRSESNLDEATGGYRNMMRIGQGIDALGGQAESTFRGSYLPMMDRLPGLADLDDEAYVGQASRDTELAYDRSRDIMTRNASRMGISPNSGRWGGLEQAWGLARAAAEAGAKTRARRMVREEDWSRQLAAAGIGQNLMNAAASYRQAGAGLYGQGAAGMRIMGLEQDRLATDNAMRTRAGEEERQQRIAEIQDQGANRARQVGAEGAQYANTMRQRWQFSPYRPAF